MFRLPVVMILQQKYEMGYLMASLMLHVYFEQMIVSSPVAMILHQKYEMGYLSHVIPNTPCLFRTNDCFFPQW